MRKTGLYELLKPNTGTVILFVILYSLFLIILFVPFYECKYPIIQKTIFQKAKCDFLLPLAIMAIPLYTPASYIADNIMGFGT